MTDPTRPEQRKVKARIFTPSGWILGTFHVPKSQTLVAFVNSTERFFTLTEVQLPRQSRPLGFLALQRSATIMVIPDASEVGPPPEEAVAHPVSCLLSGGVLMATLHLPEGERVSDHLMAEPTFFSVRGCTVGLDAPGAKASVEAVSAALINASRVIGVSEM
jgi:hypothetical protein